MKKLLLSSIILLTFAISLTLFDLSCKKTAIAAAASLNAVTQEGKMLFALTNGTPGIGIENYDGSNQETINIVLPSGLTFGNPNYAISPDHKTIFFAVTDVAKGVGYGYACNIDGTNVHQVDNSSFHVPF